MTKNSKCAIDKTTETKHVRDKKKYETLKQGKIETEIKRGIRNGRGAKKKETFIKYSSG